MTTCQLHYIGRVAKSHLVFDSKTVRVADTVVKGLKLTVVQLNSKVQTCYKPQNKSKKTKSNY